MTRAAGGVRGKCSRCGREYYHPNPVPVTLECDCWLYCPLCGALMEPYAPDLTANTYGLDGKRDLLVLRVCNNVAAHSDNRPFFSSLKPIEVELV